jgi:hypothetical protein
MDEPVQPIATQRPGRYVVVEGEDGRRRVARADGLIHEYDLARFIPVGRNHMALVDESDYARLLVFRWHLNQSGYAVRVQHSPRVRGKRTSAQFRMHRLVLEAPPDLQVDHINGDRLDNRRSNLRLATAAEQRRNEGVVRGGSSRFKGVTWSKERGLWEAQIKHQRKRMFLGRYRDEVLAARAYDETARSLFGEFARLNGV